MGCLNQSKLFLLLAIGACQVGGGSLQQDPNLAIPRANLAFSVDGLNYRGIAVVARKLNSKITIEVPNNAAKLVISNCHRQELFNKPETPFVYQFIASVVFEKQGSCLMTLEVITKQGNVQTGVIDFTESDPSLLAISVCNGRSMQSSFGATFCQARVGTMQRIMFAQSVKSAIKSLAASTCPDLIADGDTTWNYELRAGECVYAFRSDDGKTHRLTTRGYTAFEAE